MSIPDLLAPSDIYAVLFTEREKFLEDWEGYERLLLRILADARLDEDLDGVIEIVDDLHNSLTAGHTVEEFAQLSPHAVTRSIPSSVIHSLRSVDVTNDSIPEHPDGSPEELVWDESLAPIKEYLEREKLLLTDIYKQRWVSLIDLSDFVLLRTDRSANPAQAKKTRIGVIAKELIQSGQQITAVEGKKIVLRPIPGKKRSGYEASRTYYTLDSAYLILFRLGERRIEWELLGRKNSSSSKFKKLPEEPEEEILEKVIAELYQPSLSRHADWLTEWFKKKVVPHAKTKYIPFEALQNLLKNKASPSQVIVFLNQQRNEWERNGGLKIIELHRNQKVTQVLLPLRFVLKCLVEAAADPSIGLRRQMSQV